MNMSGKDDAADPRRAEILAVAVALLGELGYGKTTMLGVAKRARASKETLYAWFGNKQGLFTELICAQAARINGDLEAALGDVGDTPETVLRRFGEDLLTMLASEAAIAINRAAIAEAPRDGSFGRVLAEQGRNRTGALVIRYLERERDAGRLDFDNAERTFEALLGLLVGDSQIRMLTGALAPLEAAEIEARAERAAALFLRLFGTGVPTLRSRI
jgi:AcrR family transcriptional regulator